MQRIAPNNQLPATHFIEVWSGNYGMANITDEPCNIGILDFSLSVTESLSNITIAIFRIRENKLPTKHNFNK